MSKVFEVILKKIEIGMKHDVDYFRLSERKRNKIDNKLEELCLHKLKETNCVFKIIN